jgi:urea transport system substrate-binding protein
MEATYIGIHMWKQAVEESQEHRRGQGDRRHGRPDLQCAQRLHREQDGREEPPLAQVGVHWRDASADGQFNVVWKTPGPVKAKPWSPYIEGNDKKPDEPAKK